ncbi:hypothetical protein E2C01_009492 [Portunus trituberculatus]|uniref:Uncharacterized protein n=1 Tax=Portunus trituberculatus TaxID=210409 RepID=A0A5B7D5W9_PORTR|nr:hypothetical protein [Portunus trituberculatus]
MYSTVLGEWTPSLHSGLDGHVVLAGLCSATRQPPHRGPSPPPPTKPGPSLSSLFLLHTSGSGQQCSLPSLFMPRIVAHDMSSTILSLHH